MEGDLASYYPPWCLWTSTASSQNRSASATIVTHSCHIGAESYTKMAVIKDHVTDFGTLCVATLTWSAQLSLLSTRSLHLSALVLILVFFFAVF
eukprot:776915-Amphidinium_carterae.3